MNNNLKSKILLGLYFLTIFSLFLYSFTQIDLSLTFSRITLLRNIVSSFQHIGYFDRPLSLYLYFALIISLLISYLYFLKISIENKINKKTFWKILIVTTTILVFSYNAFSYDLFNYIFDAKIFTHYYLNPYLHKALDFPGDPMLSFMRWTHRAYPYGPLWLLLTIPLSYIGMNLFLPTFFMFKALVAFSFLGSLYFISKILKKIAPEKEVFGLVFFGLNPLVIIESLVSGHLDVVMIFFALWSVYLLINKKYFYAFLVLILSIGIKFATVFLMPIFILAIIKKAIKKSINLEFIFRPAIILTAISVIVASIYSGNFQPWYLLFPLSFAVFISDKYYVFIPSIVISFFALLNYAPYLYLGNWDKPVPAILSTINITSWFVSFVVVCTVFIFKKKKKV